MIKTLFLASHFEPESHGQYDWIFQDMQSGCVFKTDGKRKMNIGHRFVSTTESYESQYTAELGNY